MTRARATELVQKLRDAAKLQDPVAKAAIELVQLQRDAARESLVTADGDDMLRKQGEARAFDRLHRDLITIPPSITPSETPR